ncbi:hypothetical protein YC2023_070782 [Brassica napus]
MDFGLVELSLEENMTPKVATLLEHTTPPTYTYMPLNFHFSSHQKQYSLL